MILKKIKDFSGQKKQAGLSLRTKKRIFWLKVGPKIEYKGQKLTNLKKKRTFRAKKQAGAELKKKKDFLGPKLGKNLGIRSRN